MSSPATRSASTCVPSEEPRASCRCTATCSRPPAPRSWRSSGWRRSRREAVRVRLHRRPAQAHGRDRSALPPDRGPAPGRRRRPRCPRSTGARSAERDRARHRDARRARVHALRGGDPAVRLHAGVPRDARLLRAGARGDRLRDLLRPGRDARGPEQAARREGLRHRVALRLEPKRRQVRRDDGRRHGARGLQAERGARPRPAAPAHLVPGGGGIRLRTDAARKPDHRPAGDRGGAARAVQGDRRRPQLLGARRGRGIRARALAGVASDPGRPPGLGRAPHRAGSGAPGHGQPHRHRHGDRRLHPRRRGPGGPCRPRRRHAHGLPARRRVRRRRGSILEVERLAREAGDGTVGTVGEIEFQPGLINVVPGPGPTLARHARRRRGGLPLGREEHRVVRTARQPRRPV